MHSFSTLFFELTAMDDSAEISLVWEAFHSICTINLGTGFIILYSWKLPTPLLRLVTESYSKNMTPKSATIEQFELSTVDLLALSLHLTSCGFVPRLRCHSARLLFYFSRSYPNIIWYRTHQSL
mmetsp:Transcript_12976/g.26323  ORF Transcript_12976/g.26323 Transcript_12976/m.26323 type:complete len:124 (-) Transcript_12976:41-412(-)